MALDLNTHTNHLRLSKISKNEEGKLVASYSTKMECGRKVNYPRDEAKIGDFMQKETRCKVCEKRYNEVTKEIERLKNL